MPKRTSEKSPQKAKLFRSTNLQERESVRDLENHSPIQQSEDVGFSCNDVHFTDIDENLNHTQASVSFEENSSTSLENVLPTHVLDEDSDQDSDDMDIDDSSPDSSHRHVAGSLSENILSQTIEIGKSNSNPDCVLRPSCALLNSGGGVLHIKISDYYNLKSPLQKLDKFWQKVESKLDAMIKPSVYANLFDRVVKEDEIFFFIKAPDHCCTLEFNLFSASDTKVTEASFKETVKLLQDRPIGKKKNYRYCKISLQDLPSLPEKFFDKQKLKFHESKQIQFKCFPSKNPILHNNNRTQQEKIVKQISAFGNCSGGVILVGVEDDGTVIGQDLSSQENSEEDLESRVESIINEMKWPCSCKRKRHWDIKFFPVKGKEHFYVIAIYVAGIKGGVFAKNPKSYELRLGDDGKETIFPLEFCEWKRRMLHGTQMLQDERKAVKEMTEKLKSLSLSGRVLLTVKGSVERILESFFKVEAECPVSPKGFVENLPETAQAVVKRIQRLSSRGRSRALLVGSRSWRACVSNKDDDVGESLPVDGVICDLLLFSSELGGLHLFTLCDTDRVDEILVSYSHSTAKALKKVLVIQGGCHEKFYVTPHVVPCHAPAEQIGQICPDSRYPTGYELDRGKLNCILKSLVIVLGTIPSALSSKQGISFFNLLTKEQFQLLYEEIDRFRELWIKGAAGTGKTVVAVEFIKELRRRDPNLEQEEIMYVCENTGLMKQISKLRLCQCRCRKSFMLMDECLLGEVKHVIMDEVQSFRDEDRPKPDGDTWLKKARKLVRQQSVYDPGYLWLFIDNRQINHRWNTGIPDEREQKPWFRLKKVIRNTKRIVDYATKIFLDQDSAREFEMGHDFEGEDVVVIDCQKDNEIPTLKDVIQSCCSEGYSHGDITLLYGKQHSIPEHLESDLNIGTVVEAEQNDSEYLVASTFRKYGGLERPVVVLVNVENSLPYGSNQNAIYCCATRAIVKLVILRVKRNTIQPSRE